LTADGVPFWTENPDTAKALATLSACAAGSYEAPQLDPVSGRTSAS
jgi:hypothetical protein